MLQKIKKSPQVVWFPLDTVVTPSHVALQLVSFLTDVLIVFPGQMEHESPSMKYPALQTKRKDFFFKFKKQVKFQQHNYCLMHFLNVNKPV